MSEDEEYAREKASKCAEQIRQWRLASLPPPKMFNGLEFVATPAIYNGEVELPAEQFDAFAARLAELIGQEVRLGEWIRPVRDGMWCGGFYVVFKE